MASLVLGAVGAVVGGYFGGPTGASIGWALGSGVGSMIGPGQHVEGPRVNDRPVMSSTLGTPMAQLYGAGRMTGNVIDCSIIREVSTTQSSGKGGPKVSSTTYTYNCDIAIDLCAGPMAAIRKMWLDSKLVYDVSSGNSSAATVLASSVHASALTFYTGDEAQLPDPTLEALHGAGNVPAYRGRCYVVLTQLDCPSGRIPQLAFEVVEVAAASTASLEWATVTSLDTHGQMGTVLAKTAYSFDRIAQPVASYAAGPGYYQGPFYGAAVAGGNSLPCAVQGGPFAMSYSFDSGYYTDPMRIYTRDLSVAGQGVSQLTAYASGSDGDSIRPLYAAYDSISGLFCAVAPLSTGSPTARSTAITIFNGLAGGTLSDPLFSYSQPMAFYNNVIYCCDYTGANTVLQMYDGATGAHLGGIAGGPACGGTGSPTYLGLQCIVCANDRGVYVMENAPSYETAARRVWKVDVAGSTGWKLLTSAAHYNNAPGSVTTFYCCDQYAIVGPCAVEGGTFLSDATSHYKLVPFVAIDSVAPSLASVIAAECQRAGLAAGQIDVSTLTDTVLGYPIYRVSPARSNLEPLLMAFFLDALEVDGKVVFRKRASAPKAAAIAFDDLAAVDNGSMPGDPFPLVRTQEVDLPRSFTVQYLDVNADYQSGAEQSTRQVTKSLNDVQQDVAVCMDGNRAKQIADVRMYDAWSTRNARSGQLTRNYAYLCPGDVVTIEYPRATFGDWLLTSVHDTGALMQIQAVEANPSLYVSAAPGAATNAGQTVDPLAPPTKLQFLDIPLLRDVDNYPGPYLALAGYGPGFVGAEVWVAPSSATAPVSEGSVSASAPIGRTENALGAFTPGTIDETNTLTVNVFPDALASTTRDAVIDTFANACAIGAPGRWEICQFIRVAPLGNGRYTLSGFRRGVRGTEANTGNHAAGDAFVLFNTAGMLKPHFQLTDINVAKSYQAVTRGDRVDTTPAATNTDTGGCLKPLSPIDVRGSIQGDGLHITWGRRSRLSSNWLAGNMPLGETAEQYTVNICQPTPPYFIIRQYKAATPACLYAKADQVADHAPATVKVDVYQISGDNIAGQAGSAFLQSGYASLPQISTLTIGGVFQSGATIKVSFGPAVGTYTTVPGDATLAGVASSIAAQINAQIGSTYSAVANGAVVTITGPTGKPFSVDAAWTGNCSMVIALESAASAAQAGTRAELWGRFINPVTGTWPVVSAGTTFAMTFSDGSGFYKTYTWSASAGAQRSDAIGYLAGAIATSGDPATYGFGLAYTDDHIILNPPVGQNGWSISGYCTDSRIEVGCTIVSLGQPYVPVAIPQKSLMQVIGTPAAGSVFSATLGSYTYSYTAAGGDTAQTVATALIAAINAGGHFTATQRSWDPAFNIDDVDIVGNTAAAPFAMAWSVTTGSMTVSVAKTQTAS